MKRHLQDRPATQEEGHRVDLQNRQVLDNDTQNHCYLGTGLDYIIRWNATLAWTYDFLSAETQFPKQAVSPFYSKPGFGIWPQQIKALHQQICCHNRGGHRRGEERLPSYLKTSQSAFLPISYQKRRASRFCLRQHLPGHYTSPEPGPLSLKTGLSSALY